jgi:hypothetical protein
MQPIINPWVFYWIDVIDNMRIVFIIFLVIFIITACVSAGTWAYTASGESNMSKEDDIRVGKNVKKILRLALIFTAVFAIMTTLLPSKKTMYTMVIVQSVTPNNIEAVGDTITGAVDYITEKVEEIIDGDDSTSSDDSDDTDDSDKDNDD